MNFLSRKTRKMNHLKKIGLPWSETTNWPNIMICTKRIQTKVIQEMKLNILKMSSKKSRPKLTSIALVVLIRFNEWDWLSSRKAFYSSTCTI